MDVENGKQLRVYFCLEQRKFRRFQKSCLRGGKENSYQTISVQQLFVQRIFRRSLKKPNKGKLIRFFF